MKTVKTLTLGAYLYHRNEIRKWMAVLTLSVLVAVLAIAPEFAHASSGYCDGRPNAQAVNKCYKDAIDMQNQMMKKRLRLIRESRLVSGSKKADIARNQATWDAEINNRCVGNLRCVYDSAMSRNAYLSLIKT